MEVREATGREKRNVLVADDDAGVRYVVRWALEGAGMRVRSAASGQEAIEAIESELPELLVLDLTMPITTGSDVARRARTINRATPILLITGDGRAREKARAIGAYEYLEKPFEVGELVSAVERGFLQASL